MLLLAVRARGDLTTSRTRWGIALVQGATLCAAMGGASSVERGASGVCDVWKKAWPECEGVRWRKGWLELLRVCGLAGDEGGLAARDERVEY